MKSRLRKNRKNSAKKITAYGDGKKRKDTASFWEGQKGKNITRYGDKSFGIWQMMYFML